MEAFVAAYRNQNRWDIRRQILSSLSDQFTFEEMELLIPYLIKYKFKAARRHQVQHGKRAAPTAEKESLDRE